MYSKNGEFGLVKVKSHSFIKGENLFTFQNCGWHKCNDKYRIERKHSEQSLIFVTVSGEGALIFDGKKYRLKKNTAAFVPKGKDLTYFTPEGGLWEFYWIHPSGMMCEKLLEETENRGVFINKTGRVNFYGEKISEIHSLCDKRGIKYDAEISMKVSEFLHSVVIDLMDFKEDLSLSERAMQYFTEHKCENITVESCAKALYVSPSHLIRVFKKETGQTPHKFLMDEKLKEADSLIKLGVLSLKEVASLTSFSSSAHLITAYKKKYGKTPKCNR